MATIAAMTYARTIARKHGIMIPGVPDTSRSFIVREIAKRGLVTEISGSI